jgi:hypothetical protein
MEFENAGRQLRVRVEGRLVFNAGPHIVKAAVGASASPFFPSPWCGRTSRSGGSSVCSRYHLYYPSRRRQPTPAFALLVEALRYRG